MKKQYLFFVFILIVNTTYSQQFVLTEENTASNFTIDRFENEVYLSPWYSNFVGKYTMDTGEHIITEFSGFPVFMHNSHKAIYLDVTDSSNTYYLYDFEADTSKIVWEYKYPLNKLMLAWNPNHKISPNDSLFFIGSPTPIYDTTRIKSTQDFIMYGDGWPYCWSSDSTVIYKSLDHSLAEYYAYSTKIDTLVDMGEGNDIVSFDYNIKENLLAYSVQNDFYIYDIQNKERIFEFIGSHGGYVELNDIKWNEDETKLAFFGYDYTNPISYIYVYNLDSNSLKYVNNSSYGSKAHLEWLNNDTILYVDVEKDRLLGFDITSELTGAEEIKSDLYPKKFRLEQNYPNPFNPSTTIKYSIQNIVGIRQLTDDLSLQSVTLKIYDILGREVATLVNKEQTPGSYSVKFDASSINREITSGIYFYKLQAGNFVESKKMILLK